MFSTLAEEHGDERDEKGGWSQEGGVNFGDCGSYGINDCLVQREFGDEFTEPYNENTANEMRARLCILMRPSRQTANDFRYAERSF